MCREQLPLSRVGFLARALDVRLVDLDDGGFHIESREEDDETAAIATEVFEDVLRSWSGNVRISDSREQDVDEMWDFGASEIGEVIVRRHEEIRLVEEADGYWTGESQGEEDDDEGFWYESDEDESESDGEDEDEEDEEDDVLFSPNANTIVPEWPLPFETTRETTRCDEQRGEHVHISSRWERHEELRRTADSHSLETRIQALTEPELIVPVSVVDILGLILAIVSLVATSITIFIVFALCDS